MNGKPFWESKTFRALVLFLAVKILQRVDIIPMGSLGDLADEFAMAAAVLGLRMSTGGGLSIKRKTHVAPNP